MNTNPYELEHRMYFLVHRSLSPIQRGIQAGHASLEYANEYGDTVEYKRFIDVDKTWILLDGGSSNEDGTSRYNNNVQQGSLQIHRDTLIAANWKHTCFYEPDINNALTAICLLVDERSFDRRKYMDPLSTELAGMQTETSIFDFWRDRALYEYWSGIIGTDAAWMRVWLRQFNLA